MAATGIGRVSDEGHRGSSPSCGPVAKLVAATSAAYGGGSIAMREMAGETGRRHRRDDSTACAPSERLARVVSSPYPPDIIVI